MCPYPRCQERLQTDPEGRPAPIRGAAVRNRVDDFPVTAVFTWACPTALCPGVIITEAAPGQGSVAWCKGPTDRDDPYCGREVRWSAEGNCWIPVGQYGTL